MGELIMSNTSNIENMNTSIIVNISDNKYILKLSDIINEYNVTASKIVSIESVYNDQKINATKDSDDTTINISGTDTESSSLFRVVFTTTGTTNTYTLYLSITSRNDNSYICKLLRNTDDYININSSRRGYSIDNITFIKNLREAISQVITKINKEKVYSIEYDLNGGSWNNLVGKTIYNVGDTYTIDDYPIKIGYMFNGWSEDSNNNARDSQNIGIVVKNTDNKNLKLTALWSKKSYKVSLHDNDGTTISSENGSSIIYNPTVTYNGDNIAFSDNDSYNEDYETRFSALISPVKGKIRKSWLIKNGTSNNSIYIDNLSNMDTVYNLCIKHNIIDNAAENIIINIHPVFENITYSLKYNVNDTNFSISDESAVSAKYTFGDTMPLLVPSENGATFIGWSLYYEIVDGEEIREGELGITEQFTLGADDFDKTSVDINNIKTLILKPTLNSSAKNKEITIDSNNNIQIADKYYQNNNCIKNISIVTKVDNADLSLSNVYLNIVGPYDGENFKNILIKNNSYFKTISAITDGVIIEENEESNENLYLKNSIFKIELKDIVDLIINNDDYIVLDIIPYKISKSNINISGKNSIVKLEHKLIKKDGYKIGSEYYIITSDTNVMDITASIDNYIYKELEQLSWDDTINIPEKIKNTTEKISKVVYFTRDDENKKFNLEVWL